MSYDNTKALDSLSIIYNHWLIENGLPQMCALELLQGMAQDLTPYQRRYLAAFIQYWEMVAD
jgi:hypothetical protein